MSNFERKIRRQQQRHHQKEAQKDIKEKMVLYERLEDMCLVCETPFDKTNKQMIQEWYVVVRNEKEPPNLYCPPCWKHALKHLEMLDQTTKDHNS
jgi:hypothetical protein